MGLLIAAKKSNPRRTNSSRRNKLRDKVRRKGLPCALCGEEIDYSLPAGDPMSYELDEIVPVSRGGNPYDEDNVQPTHRICNQRKGNKMPGDLVNRGWIVTEMDW